MPRPKKFPSEIRPVTSLANYLRQIEEIRKQWKVKDGATSRGDEKRLWFRGQGDATWGLTPSRWREAYAEENESEMRLAFESAGRQLVALDSQRDKWGWYFLMAHYGAPTRLLDWTANPLVALYFAVASAKAGTDAAVWVVDPWQWNKVHIPKLYGPALPGWEETEPYLWELESAMDTDNRDTKRKWPIAVEPPHIDRRITAQDGRFMLFGNVKDMVSSTRVNPPARKPKARLDKIVVAHSRTVFIRDELHNVGMNQKVIFPDLSGLAQHICWEYKAT